MILLGQVTEVDLSEKRGRVRAVIPGFSGPEATDYIERVGSPHQHFIPEVGDIVAVVVIPDVDGAVKLFWLGVVNTRPVGTSPAPLSTLSIAEHRRSRIIDFNQTSLNAAGPNPAGYLIGDLLNGTLTLRSSSGVAYVEVNSVTDEVNIDGTKINLGLGSTAATRGWF